ncbi:hypothetical protein ACFE04_016747 [Oxalis oulophora]
MRNMTMTMSPKLFVNIRYMTSSSRVIDKAVKDGELRVFIVSGEVSGDTIASRLMSSLVHLSPVPLRFSGVGGGSMMSKQGLKSIFPMEDISVMGISELLPHIYNFRVRLKQTIEAAFSFRPHVVVTVDSKGFSFRLLKQLRARYNRERLEGPVHFHYVAPSFWAWKGGEERLKGLAPFVDHVLCILPNEEEVCRSNGLLATFVGHPILEDALELNSVNVYPLIMEIQVVSLVLGKDILENEWRVKGDGESFRSNYGVSSGAKVVSVLPGSRLQEVTRMLPIFANAIELLRGSFSELTTVIHVAPNKHVDNYINRTVTDNWPVPFILIPGGDPQLKYDVFSASSVALCTSGTVAVEMQLARLPCLVAYRAHFLTEWFIRYKAKIPYISLPNILLNSPIIPEALMEACTPTNLASLLRELMQNKSLQKEQILAAEKFVRLLYPSSVVKKYRGDDTRSNMRESSPSMIAAFTILHHHVKQ